MKRIQNEDWLYEAFGRDTELPPSFERRLAEVCDTVRQNGPGKETAMTKRTKRNIRTTLLVAAVILALSVSAYAVFQHTLGDAVLPDTQEETVAEALPAADVLQPTPEPDSDATEPPAPAEEAGEGYIYAAADNQRLHMSLNGFSDSPEYQAYAEWNEWNDAWWAENPDPWTALGEDDTYFEGPANYAWFYQACFTEQAEKLDEILDKYGLTAHTAMCGFESEAELCAMLGMEDVVSFEGDVFGGYMYDDGSFKAEMLWFEDEETWEYSSMTLFFAVRGSFSQISGFMPADCEEWSYTTADGTEVLLALGRDAGAAEDQNSGAILAELEGGYVYVGFGGLTDRSELEQFADGIGFAALNARFAPGADTSGIAAAVTEKREAELAAMAETEKREAELAAMAESAGE